MTGLWLFGGGVCITDLFIQTYSTNEPSSRSHGYKPKEATDKSTLSKDKTVYDYGVDAQQPGAAVIPWERMASELDSRGHARPGTHFRGTDTHN